MPIIDRIIPQDAGTIEAGSTVNKSQQILDEEAALAADKKKKKKKKQIDEQDVGTKPSVSAALPEIPQAAKPEKVLDDTGRIKHIDHGDKIRVPLTSMLGFGKSTTARREQFIGEALDKMSERVGPDRNLKINGNNTFMRVAIAHAVKNKISLEVPKKWEHEYAQAQEQALNVAVVPGQAPAIAQAGVSLSTAGTVSVGGIVAVAESAKTPAMIEPEKQSITPSVEPATAAVLGEYAAGDYVRVRHLGADRKPVLDFTYLIIDPARTRADCDCVKGARLVTEDKDGIKVIGDKVEQTPLYGLSDDYKVSRKVEHLHAAVPDLTASKDIQTAHLNRAVTANTRVIGLSYGQQRNMTGKIEGVSSDRKTLEVKQAGISRRVVRDGGQEFQAGVGIEAGAVGKLSITKDGTLSFTPGITREQKRNAQQVGGGLGLTE